jgi:hypothetical protein
MTALYSVKTICRALARTSAAGGSNLACLVTISWHGMQHLHRQLKYAGGRGGRRTKILLCRQLVSTTSKIRQLLDELQQAQTALTLRVPAGRPGRCQVTPTHALLAVRI